MTAIKSVLRKIGSNRGRPRLWVEGKVLIEAGFKRGDRFILVGDPTVTAFEIRRHPEGETLPPSLRMERLRTVSGKGDKPIIDIVGDEIERRLGVGVKTVQLDYMEGIGRISVRRVFEEQRAAA